MTIRALDASSLSSFESGSTVGPDHVAKRGPTVGASRPFSSENADRLNVPPVLAPSFTAVERSPLAVNPRSWDRFAESCGASLRSSHAHMMAWTIKNLGFYRLRLFEVYVGSGGDGRKIGQCAIGAARVGPNAIFIDRLQLLPEHEASWRLAMEAILTKAGGGQYDYGWVLSLEAPREAELAQIAGVEMDEVRPLVVHAVDFAQWSNWDAYYSAISENSRRNAKSALKNFKTVEVKTRSGIGAVRFVPAIMRLRSGISERKGLDIKESGAAIGYAATILSCPRYMTASVVSGDGMNLACFYGAEFGQNTYYLEGGSAQKNGGTAWHLLIAMLRRTYERTPTGKLIMGYVDYSTHDEEKSAGLLRSRQACRVSDYATSTLKFRYTPA